MSTLPTLHFINNPSTQFCAKTTWGVGVRTQATDPVTPINVEAIKIVYHTNGAPKTVVQRYPNGKVGLIIHKDNNERFHGICKRYNTKGKLIQVCTYKHGVLISGRKLPNDFAYGYFWKQSHKVAQEMGII